MEESLGENEDLTLSNVDHDKEMIVEEPAEFKHNRINQNVELDEGLDLQIKEQDLVISHLKIEVLNKTDVLNELEKQKGILEKEVTNLRRDRENAVIRYAVVEKQILESKNARDTMEKKSKELQREVELLNGKIKGGAADKTRICKILDEKCHELKCSQKEIERLKYDNTGLDSKLKWHLSKIKLETEAKEVAEKKIVDLTAEINQLKIKEINRVKEEVDVERNMLAEKQLIQQNATLILLKHNNEEKSRRIESLDKKCHQLEADLENLNKKHGAICTEHESLIQERASLNHQISDSQCLLDKQMMKIAELQSNQNDLEIVRTQLSLEKEENRQLKNDIKSLSSQVDEQNVEAEKWRNNEIDLLQLNKELTESVVKLKNECSMSISKATAVSLENELIKKDKSYYENIISDLRSQLDEEIKKRNSDCQLMAKHISEKTKSIECLQRKIEEITGELEAQQKKHSQTLKELTREINQMKKKSERLTNDEVKKSPTPSTTSESSVESQVNEYPTISLEPSQKSLIDRIVRLQNEIVRQSEKIDFLENHQAQLVEELKRLRKTNKK